MKEEFDLYQRRNIRQNYGICNQKYLSHTTEATTKFLVGE